MKTKLIRTMAILLSAMTVVWATPSDAIKGSTILVGVLATAMKDGNPVGRAQSDENGQLSFKDLPPGHYEIVVDGKALSAAIDNANPPPKRESSGGLSIGIGGGMFGGGGHSSSGHEGVDGHPDRGHGSSQSGGVGVGFAIPLGSGGDPGSNPPPSLRITMSEILIVGLDKKPPEPVSVDFPYCRDGGQGARVGFTIPDGGGTVTMQMSIADQASAGNLTSY
ncbi:MAG TPA: prealbumin-like fold domain-containing protein [Rhizomicrobium sp.]|jgi:hypothetical protein|nr:prealbumin-like fold domain-containing protein [Rhizomicrobium sp.]